MLALLPLTVPEVRRLLLALAEPPERFSFRLAWSWWRRRHQAAAKRAHVARRARRPLVLPVGRPAGLPLPTAQNPELTEEQWQRILPLLPPPRTGRGRRPRDHRQMVAAMLWVERTGGSWRSVPSRFGPWPGVHARYLRWRTSGLWAHILAVLDQQDDLEVAA